MSGRLLRRMSIPLNRLSQLGVRSATIQRRAFFSGFAFLFLGFFAAASDVGSEAEFLDKIAGFVVVVSLVEA